MGAPRYDEHGFLIPEHSDQTVGVIVERVVKVFDVIFPIDYIVKVYEPSDDYLYFTIRLTPNAEAPVAQRFRRMTCPLCDGVGSRNGEVCRDCGGIGHVPAFAEARLSVKGLHRWVMDGGGLSVDRAVSTIVARMFSDLMSFCLDPTLSKTYMDQLRVATRSAQMAELGSMGTGGGLVGPDGTPLSMN